MLAVGFDHFGELANQGVEVDAAGIPGLDAARAAWAAYGLRIIAGRDPAMVKSWGEKAFGPPGAG